MEQIFCTDKAETAEEKRFVSLVVRGDAPQLRDFLAQNPECDLNKKSFSFGKPAIVQARENKELVDILLEHGADIDARSDWDAGSYGALNETSFEMAQYLLERGARLDIHTACEHDMREEVLKFLEQDPESVHQRGPDGQLPLHYAANLELATLLVDAGADINARCLDHNSSAAEYCVDSRKDIARFLVERGAGCNIFLACALGDLERAKELVAANPKCLEERLGEGDYEGHILCWKLGFGRTPALVAVEKEQTELVEFFRGQLSDLDRFCLDCWAPHPEHVKAALQKNPDLVTTLPESKQRMVADAAWEGRSEAVRVMLEAGFSVNARGDHQSTPLDRACVQGHLDTVRTILDFNPDFTVTNEFGGVPLTAALWGAENWAPADHVGAARLLLQAGARGNPQDHKDGCEGLGVLMAWMSRAGIRPMVELLLEFGAPANARSREGVSALELAKEAGYQEIVELLRAKTTE